MVKTCIVHCVLTFWFWKEIFYKRKLSYRGDKGREIVMGQLVIGCPRRRGQRSVDVDIYSFVTPFLITVRLCRARSPLKSLGDKAVV